MAKGVGVAAARDKIVEAFELVHQELQKLADQELVEVFAEPDVEPETTAQFNTKSYELVEAALCSDIAKPTLTDVRVIEPPIDDADTLIC
jgi:hypothetical protein